MLVAWYILISHLVQGLHKCSTKFYYTQIFVLGMLPKLFLNIRCIWERAVHSVVSVPDHCLSFYFVFLTFNPLFDANILNHINDMISSLL